MGDSARAGIIARLVNFIELHIGVSKFDPAAPFTSVGIDSFVLMELVLFAEREYGVRLPLGKVAECSSLNELGGIISATLPARS